MVGWVIEFNRVIGGVASKVVVWLGLITNSQRRVVWKPALVVGASGETNQKVHITSQ